jgi:hypothetical protein
MDSRIEPGIESRIPRFDSDIGSGIEPGLEMRVASIGAAGAGTLTSLHRLQVVSDSGISPSHREHRFIHTTPECTEVHHREGKARTRGRPVRSP